MNIRLSHYGWMVTRRLVRTDQLHLGVSPETDLLLDLWTGDGARYLGSRAHNALLAQNMIELVDEAIGREQIRLRYARNPFEHVQKAIFEFTTFCNFNCEHCYNAQAPRLTETHPRILMDAADVFLRMGIRRFDFVGGEVSRYGNGWLDVVERLMQLDKEIEISLYTNGWWLEQVNFHAAGQNFVDDLAYLEELNRRGVRYVTFSLDGPEQEHDRSRHHSGLYQRILRGFERVSQASLTPRASLLVRPEWSEEQRLSFLAEIATRLYDLDPQLPILKRALRLAMDPSNSVSAFIDVGNGAHDERLQFPVLDQREHPLYCRNFYRLSPSLTIKANGELATCRLSQAGEGYGNIHERPLVEILNRFDDAFVYQLHASGQLESYLPLVDRSLFGTAFTHLCSLRSILTLLARKMHEQQVSPDDLAGVQRINREVAALTGHVSKTAEK